MDVEVSPGHPADPVERDPIHHPLLSPVTGRLCNQDAGFKGFCQDASHFLSDHRRANLLIFMSTSAPMRAYLLLSHLDYSIILAGPWLSCLSFLAPVFSLWAAVEASGFCMSLFW